MTRGNLAMIACPILEDEMIYSLSNDDEVGTIIVMDNPHAKSVKPKLEKNGLEYSLCTEDEFLNGDVSLPDDGYNVVIWMMDLALHEFPDLLRDGVYDASKRIEDRVDAIILYFGLCGNGLKHVEEWGKENLSIPITILKDGTGLICDDCIAVAIGGTAKYLKLLRAYPGIMYFTPAYATNFNDLKQRLEMFRGVDANDDSMMKMIYELADYHYVMKIPTGLGDEDDFQAATEDFARRVDFEILNLDKEWCTLEPAVKSYDEAKSFLK